MERYGYDDYGWAEPRGSGRFGGRGFGYDQDFDARPYAEGAGWSRPEFNLSLGAFGGLRSSRYGTYDYRGPRGGRSARRREPEGWRSGEPWGMGGSDVDRLHARDLMTENPEAVTPDTNLIDVARLMRDLDVGIIPVVADLDAYQLQGVITDRDITIRAAADGKDMKKSRAGDFMSGEVGTVQENDTVRDVLTVMKRERVRRVPVTDAFGRLVGIIAQADLAVDYAGLDEERELEVEEVLERISEPARPRSRSAGTWGDPRRGGGWSLPEGDFGGGYERHLADRVRHGWHTLRREARELLDRGYDRGWR